MEIEQHLQQISTRLDQIGADLRRVDGRIDTDLKRIDDRIDADMKRIDTDLKRIDDRIDTDLKRIDADMKQIDGRIEKLESFAIDARERLAQTATKDDLYKQGADHQKAITDLIKWIVGSAIALGGSAIVVGTFVLNNAIPKAPPQLPPIVIQIPAGAPARPSQ